MSRLVSILYGVLPFFTDTTPAGKRKLSIGRAPLAVVLLTMVYKYITLGVGPDNQILAFIAMALAYNGFGKNSTAGGNGGEGVVAPPVEQQSPG